MDHNESITIPLLRSRITQGTYIVGRYDNIELMLKVMKIANIRRNGTLDVVLSFLHRFGFKSESKLQCIKKRTDPSFHLNLFFGIRNS